MALHACAFVFVESPAGNSMFFLKVLIVQEGLVALFDCFLHYIWLMLQPPEMITFAAILESGHAITISTSKHVGVNVL